MPAKSIAPLRGVAREVGPVTASRVAVADLRMASIVSAGLMASGIESAGDLASRTPRWLQDHVSYAPGQRLGLHAVREIRAALREIGLSLGQAPAPTQQPRKAPTNVDLRAMAACALSLRELVWHGLDRIVAMHLAECGFSCAGELACRSA